MTTEPSLDVLYGILTQQSAYLRTPVRLPGKTCLVCAGPIQGQWTICFQCNKHRNMPGIAGLADRVGSLIYAVEGKQSYAVMAGYKSSNPGPNQKRFVTVLAMLGAILHRGCAGQLAGQPVTQWATIPSSTKPERIGKLHPLREILWSVLPALPEVVVAANPPVVEPRSLRPANFRIESPVEAGGHVLVIDDNWTQGGHAQSVCAVMKQAGARQVSMLTLTRVLNPWDKVQGPFIRDFLDQQSFAPHLCPWTGAGCPPAP